MARVAMALAIAIVSAACSSDPEGTPAPADAAQDQFVETNAEASADTWTAPDTYDEPTSGQACANIASACHDLDPGYGPLHECHEVGHTGTLADCEKREAECVALCKGGGDAATD